MTFFSHKPPVVPQQKIAVFKPPIMSVRGDRQLVSRVKYEASIEARKQGVKTSAKTERKPNGCLFKMAGGFFDLDGFWCVRASGHEVKVTRGAPRKIMSMLSEKQKADLNRNRLRARRAGIR